MSKTDFKKALASALLKSIQGNEYIIPTHEQDKYYFNEEYFKTMRSFMDDSLLSKFKREFRYYGKGRYKMCSVASSARLCFLRFFHEPNIEFEKKIPHGLETTPPHFDAFDSANMIFYECKTQELFNKKGTLSESYKKLFDKILPVGKIKTENGKLYPTLKQLGINYDKENIYELYFDLKQMLCHLFALAHRYNTEKKEETTLQYIIFTPNNKEEIKDPILLNFYSELDAEIAAIWNSEKIKGFCKAHEIKLEDPDFKSVDTIDDFINKKLISK